MRQGYLIDSTDHDACGVGFIVQLGSFGSREVAERALTALSRRSHRGGVDADGCSGDGAGPLTAIPQKFIRDRAREAGIELPEIFGLGMAFLPRGREAEARAAVEAATEETGLRCLGWRAVPTDTSLLGPRAVAALPATLQCSCAPDCPPVCLVRLLFLRLKPGDVA